MSYVKFWFLAVLLSVKVVANAETLKLATVEWPPFYSSSLPENGFYSALTKEIFKRAGYDIQIKFLPWKRALESARNGSYDGLLGAYFSEDRAKDFVYTEEVANNDEVFVQKKGKGITYSTINDLKAFKIGGMRGGAQVEELKKMGFNIDEAANSIPNMQKLAAGRLDLIIVGKQEFNFQLANEPVLHNFQNLFDVLEPPYKSFGLFNPITKRRPDAMEIVAKFNSALAEVKADGTYEAVLSRFGQ